MRGMYLERLGKEPDEPLDDRVYRIFSVGNQMEEWLCNLIKDRPEIKDYKTQLRVEDKKLGVSGYADLFLEFKDGKKWLYEIKTKHSRSFWWMVKKGQGAMQQHKYQLWLYLYLLDIEQGSIIYLSKDDLEIREYVIRRDNKKLEKQVMTILNTLNECWEKKVLPPLPEKDSWQAKYCRYHKQCLKSKII